MDITVKDISIVKKEFKVTVSPDEVKKQRRLVEKEVAKVASLPGFRPGKLPSELLRSRFGKEIDHQIKSNLIRQSVVTALSDKKIIPLGEPFVEKIEPLTEENFGFTFTIEVKPELDITDYKEIELRSPPPPDFDETVEQTLKRIAEEQAILTPRAENESLKEDDVIETAITTVLDGKPSEPPSTEKLPISLLERMAPGISARLIGAKVGDTIRYEMNLPNANEKMPRVEIDVPISRIYKRDIPKIDDEFARSHDLAESLEDYKAKVKKYVKEGYEERLKTLLSRELIEKIISLNPFPAPEALVNRQIDSMIAFDEKEKAYFYRVSGELRRTEDVKVARGELWDIAVFIVKEVLILDAVARKEKIEVREEELDEFVERYAKKNKLNNNKAKAKLKKSGEWEELVFMTLQQKTRDFLLAQCKIIDDGAAGEEKKGEESKAEKEKDEKAVKESSPDSGDKPQKDV
ncbi:MAG: trigger factor [Myxococcota bacterium]